MNTQHKIKNNITDLQATVANLNNKTIVATNGCFDLMHPGHTQYLEWAKSQGDFLVVLVNSDHSVRKIKGPKRPMLNENLRCTQLAALESVDAVCLFDADSPLEELLTLKPHIVVKADQYNDETLPEAAGLKAAGIQIKYAPMIKGISTSEIITKVLEAYSPTSHLAL